MQRCIRVLPGNTKAIVVAVVFLCHSSIATLIIGLYNSDAIFLATDSRVTHEQIDGTLSTYTTMKCFQISDTYCVTIANTYGGFIKETNSGIVSFLWLPKQLAVMSSNAYSLKKPIKETIASIVSDFNLEYGHYMRTKLAVGRTNQEWASRLCFWGYDGSQKGFICYSYQFEANQPPQEGTFFVRSANRVGSALTIQGESAFLPALIYAKDNPLAKLKSKEFDNTVGSVLQELPLNDGQVTNCLLQMFSLQKEHAANYSTDKGWVDEPYVIYKITKDGIVKMR